jgi:nucleoside phosphorylase
MEQALGWLLDQQDKPRFILSAGYSGALKDHEVGSLILATEVVDESGGMWQADWPGELTGDWRPPLQRGRLLCVSRLVGDPAEKRHLGQQHDALAVDMESAVIARRCAEKGVPFGCLRVISDSADQALDPKLAALLGGPRVSAWSVLKLLVRSPRLARELFRLARQTRHASRQLGLALGELLTRTEQPSQD